CVDIDTGAIIFSKEMLAALYRLISQEGKFSEELFEELVNERVRLSLYGDFLYPLAADSTLEDFYRENPEGSFCPELMAARQKVWEALRPFRMKLLRLVPAKFIHFGTTGEILKLMSSGVEDYADLGRIRHVGSSYDNQVSGSTSVLSSHAVCGQNCYLEVSYVHHGAELGDNVLLSYIDVYDEKIPSDVVVHGLKQKDGNFVARIYGTEDNPKSAFNDTKENSTEADSCIFLGLPFRRLLEKNGITAKELWEEGEEHTIWNARLYPACLTIREALQASLNLYAMTRGKGDVSKWRSQKRKSLCSGFNEADPHALIAWEKRMGELVQMDRLSKLIQAGGQAMRGTEILKSQKLSPVQEEWFEKHLQRADFGEKIRLHYYIGTALGGYAGDKQIGECFRCIGEEVLGATLENLQVKEDCRIVAAQHRVSLPLRVNWGGGWSDTPPYCNEKGGTVLNAAILLNGKKPVEVVLEKLPEPKIIFNSRDMDVYGEFEEITSLQQTGDPYDPFALQKAALLACGILPMKGGDLKEILTRMGGGFLMRSEVTGVPKGSGLGTSSILAAACVKALLEFTGIEYDEEQLYSTVLCMEQIMSTGGGWQDQ
ncbi:MAG: bifunctional fucokinase/L-fucose-1-P-guanylyltransferase, partial [Lachnospiraceae bacterium]|nr:bifunctional fucokinase/L-fucose-1-P-guanylyltransferase [Lachnospiraceae bacterium]